MSGGPRRDDVGPNHRVVSQRVTAARSIPRPASQAVNCRRSPFVRAGGVTTWCPASRPNPAPAKPPAAADRTDRTSVAVVMTVSADTTDICGRGGSIVEAMSAHLPEALARLDVTSLVGLTVAEARARVEQLGGVLQAVVDGPQIPIEASYKRDRVTVITQDDRVVRTSGFG